MTSVQLSAAESDPLRTDVEDQAQSEAPGLEINHVSVSAIDTKLSSPSEMDSGNSGTPSSSNLSDKQAKKPP